MIGVMLMKNGNVIKKTWILLNTFFTDRVKKKVMLKT